MVLANGIYNVSLWLFYLSYIIYCVMVNKYTAVK